MTSPNRTLEEKIRGAKAAFALDYPAPRTREQDEILVQRIARIRAEHSSKKQTPVDMPRLFAGIVVGGRVQGVKKMGLIKDLSTTLVRMGLGILSPCATQGDQSVVTTVHSLGGYSIGFFLDKLGNPFLRQKVSREVNHYELPKFEFAEEVYCSSGKSWDYLTYEQKKSIVRLVDIARYSSICVVFDTPDNLTSMFVKFAAAYEKPVFFLPQQMPQMLDEVAKLNTQEVSRGG